MSQTDFVEDDEISLFDLFERLRQGWRWVLGGLLLGALGAVAAIGLSTPRFEATALLQTGKVVGVVIEDAPTMVERLKSASFHLEVTRAVGDPGNGQQILSAIVLKSTPSLVEVKAKARSPDFAIRIAEAATGSLIKRQDELSAQLLKKINFELQIAKEKLANIEQDVLMLSKTLNSTAVRDDRFSQASLLTSMILQRQSEVFSLRQSVFALEASLLPPATQPARVLESIVVSSRGISSRKGLLLALGLFGGLLAGVAMVFVSTAWREAQQRRLADGTSH